MRERIAVFCDGDFWHGRYLRKLSRKLQTGSNPSYWLSKIKANRERDRRNSKMLERDGWTVLRLWETDINRDPDCAADLVKAALEKRREVIRAFRA